MPVSLDLCCFVRCCCSKEYNESMRSYAYLQSMNIDNRDYRKMIQENSPQSHKIVAYLSELYESGAVIVRIHDKFELLFKEPTTVANLEAREKILRHFVNMKKDRRNDINSAVFDTFFEDPARLPFVSSVLGYLEKANPELLTKATLDIFSLGDQEAEEGLKILFDKDPDLLNKANIDRIITYPWDGTEFVNKMKEFRDHRKLTQEGLDEFFSDKEILEGFIKQKYGDLKFENGELIRPSELITDLESLRKDPFRLNTFIHKWRKKYFDDLKMNYLDNSLVHRHPRVL